LSKAKKLKRPSREGSNSRRKHHGNEEKGYQEGCQEEKEVTKHGEAKWPR
jgi:hypothetical protein